MSVNNTQTKELDFVYLPNFVTESGFAQALHLSYQTFGPALGTAPVVLVNHALTGNSNVTGEQGWWNSLIGPGETIDTDKYTVLAFNIPGNGYTNDPELLITEFEEFTTHDIARAFLQALEVLKIEELFAIIGGSLGGSITWELATIAPNLAQHIVPIACDWKASDWLIANVRIQKRILENSNQPLHDARMHAMIFYRSAASFKQRFERSVNEEQGLFNIETWLYHHGEKLKERFQLSAYKLMNHLLATTDISKHKSDFSRAVENIESCIHLINIDSDGFYVADETRETYQNLLTLDKKVQYHEIRSVHGHDAFLIEYDQLNAFLKPIFFQEKSIKSKLITKKQSLKLDLSTSSNNYSNQVFVSSNG